MDSGAPGPFKYTLKTGIKVTFSHLPIYAGKGTGKRSSMHEWMAVSCPWIKNHKFNKIRKILRNGHRILVQHSKKLYLEDEAFEFEKLLISAIGRKDLGTGPLTNKTAGGEGVSGAIRSSKTRRKISINSKRTWANMSEEDKDQLLTNTWEGRDQWWSTLDEIGREAQRTAGREGFNDYWNSLAKEDKEIFNQERREYGQAWWANLSKKERVIALKKMQEGRKRWLENLTEMEHQQFADKSGAGPFRLRLCT